MNPLSLLSMPSRIMITALLGGAVVIGIWWHGFSQGKDSERAAYVSEVSNRRVQEAKTIQALRKRQVQREVIVKEKVRVIRQAADPINCLDAAVPVSVLGVLPSR